VVAAVDLSDREPQAIASSLWPPYLQCFNTEATEMLRALRVEVLIATEYTELLLEDGMLIRS